jgi:hypothetical protein
MVPGKKPIRAQPDDPQLIITSLAVRIENGCPKPCWAASHLVATTSKERVELTDSLVTPEQLADIRRKIALAIGIFVEAGIGPGQISITGAPVGVVTA